MDDEPRAVPTFARGFPASPELDALVDAFSRGDYAHVRSEAPRLAQQTEDDAVRTAARTLVERTRPDPLAVTLLWLAAGLLALMSAYWIAHGHAPQGSGPPAPRPSASVH